MTVLQYMLDRLRVQQFFSTCSKGQKLKDQECGNFAVHALKAEKPKGQKLKGSEYDSF